LQEEDLELVSTVFFLMVIKLHPDRDLKYLST